MKEKSRDIMGRKEDTAYLGRNVFLDGNRHFKDMKQGTPAEKILKTEVTRLVMKECANQTRKQQRGVTPSL